MKNLEKVPVA